MRGFSFALGYFFPLLARREMREGSQNIAKPAVRNVFGLLIT